MRKAEGCHFEVAIIPKHLNKKANEIEKELINNYLFFTTATLPLTLL